MRHLLLIAIAMFNYSICAQETNLNFKNLKFITEKYAEGAVSLENSTLMMASGERYGLKNVEEFQTGRSQIRGGRTRNCAKLNHTTALYVETFSGVKVGVYSKIDVNASANFSNALVSYNGNSIGISSSLQAGGSGKVTYGPSILIDLPNERKVRAGTGISLIGVSLNTVGYNTSLGPRPSFDEGKAVITQDEYQNF